MPEQREVTSGNALQAFGGLILIDCGARVKGEVMAHPLEYLSVGETRK